MSDRFQRELLISVAIIAGSFLISGAALYFIGKDLRLQGEKVGAVRTTIANSYTALNSFATLKKDVTQAANYGQAMDKILVSQDRLLDFGKWLDNLARTHQIRQNFSFSGEPVSPQETAPGHYVFSLELGGELNNIMNFVKDAEYKSPRFLTSFDSFDLIKSGDDYKVSISGRVFFK